MKEMESSLNLIYIVENSLGLGDCGGGRVGLGAGSAEAVAVVQTRDDQRLSHRVDRTDTSVGTGCSPCVGGGWSSDPESETSGLSPGSAMLSLPEDLEPFLSPGEPVSLYIQQR